MSDNKKQSFVQGAFILVVAALLVKFIGFFFKIPLTFLIKDDGMGLTEFSKLQYAYLRLLV